MKKLLLPVIALVFTVSGCKKDENSDAADAVKTKKEVQQSILNDFSSKVALAMYADMEIKMNDFYNSCLALDTVTTDNNLLTARNNWKAVRGVWEQSEAFLFGPVSTNNIDPSIDTWPVDFTALDSLMNSTFVFSQSNIDILGDELKGFHPAEYILWGETGTKTSSEFNAREKEYLVALSADLKFKASSLRSSWDPSVSGNYTTQLTTAGQSSSVYSTQISAFEEIINAMSGICDEVAAAKISEPFTLQDPSLEESPFSKNSLIDFKNNIKGVENVYFGKYQQDGAGIHTFLENYNLSLHNQIVSQLSATINAFDNVTLPFGEAIISQPNQVQNLIDNIEQLNSILTDQLLPFAQAQIVD
jgi:putative iron-regulated protein